MVQVKDRIVFIIHLLQLFFPESQISLSQILSFLPQSYLPKNLYAAISYAVKSGKIEKTKKNGETFLRLTGKGKEALKRDFPLVSWEKREWDKHFRLLIYDIPDTLKSSREILRRKIRLLGFRKLQNSVYISPFPIEKTMIELLEKYHLSQNVVFMTSEAIFSEGDTSLAERLWNLSQINSHYLQILKELKNKHLEERDRQRLKAEFVSLLERDPFLPSELLPKPWYREEILDLIKSS